MSQAAAPNGAISLADLAALNDEIAALVGAGVPLERGLIGAGSDLPRRLGVYTAELGRRLERGESLAQAVESVPALPPIYRAVVAAGAKAGRLPVALEGLATSARRLSEVRRTVILAMFYPLFILLAAYVLLFVYVYRTLPTLLPFFDRHLPWLVQALTTIQASLGPWVFALPVIGLVIYALWRYRSSRALVLHTNRLFFWLPPVGRMLRHARTSTMAEVLALLVEHNVPLHEGVVLAAETTGDPALIQSAKKMAASLERGAPPERVATKGIPPLLHWLISIGSAHGTLAPMLHNAAESYRRRAMTAAHWLRFTLPVILTVIIAGGATLLYALATFGPQIELLRRMAEPNFR